MLRVRRIPWAGLDLLGGIAEDGQLRLFALHGASATQPDWSRVGQAGAARQEAMAIDLETMGAQGQLSGATEIVSSMAAVFTAMKERIKEGG